MYPPLALVEAYITEEDSAPKVRRLHLIVVDLHRRRRMADRVLRLLVDLQVDRCAEECLHTLFFFCSTLLRCDLHTKKVPGGTPYSQHIVIRNWT